VGFKLSQWRRRHISATNVSGDGSCSDSHHGNHHHSDNNIGNDSTQHMTCVAKEQLKSYGHNLSNPDSADSFFRSSMYLPLQSSISQVLQPTWRKPPVWIRSQSSFSMGLLAMLVLNSILLGLQVQQTCDVASGFEVGDDFLRASRFLY